MKTTSCIIVLSFCALFTLTGCGTSSDQSEFREFEIKCNDGTVRSGGIYLPQGTKAGQKLPVVYMADGLVFKECDYQHLIDSLIYNKCISPVIVACSFENKMTVPGYRIAYRNAEYVESLSKTDEKLAGLFANHYDYFVNEFIPYIEKNAPVSHDSADRIFYGTSNSGDFGITLSMRNPDLVSEFWCYSPVFSDISGYGMLESEAIYRICWGVKEEVESFDYFPSLIKDIKKRGGNVTSWAFDGAHDRDRWKYWFGQELERRFPYR